MKTSCLAIAFLLTCLVPCPAEALAPNFLTDHEAVNPDGTVNMVVEIPAGSNEKWEVKKKSENPQGLLVRDIEDGRPRTVKYLPYPFNYGMVPNTVLSEEKGGDGDPVDVILLGPSRPRGSVHPVKVIGLIKLVDRGQIDYKLIGVSQEDPLGQAGSLEDLNRDFRGITAIIETFFLNYKGPGKMQSSGFDGPEEAMKFLKAFIAAPLPPAASQPGR